MYSSHSASLCDSALRAGTLPMFRVINSYNVSNPVSAVELFSGDVLILSRSDCKIYSLGRDGQMHHWAGTGTKDTRDGDRSKASFSYLSAAAVDPVTGEVFLTDSNCIRCINSDGYVQTIAGMSVQGDADGPGSQSMFNRPNGIAVDTEGNLLVSDTYNDRLRRVVRTSSWQVETIPDPQNLIKDSGSVAYNATTKTFYVCCEFFHTIPSVARSETDEYEVVEFAGTGAAGSIDGGLGEATFNGPWGLSYDVKGTLLVCDFKGRNLRVITPDGRVTSVAIVDESGKQVELCGPSHPCITYNGNVILPDREGSRVYVLDSGGLLCGKGYVTNMPQVPKTSLHAELWRLQRSGQFCDIKFKVDDEVVPAHRVVLTATSEYFRTMFSDSWDGHSGTCIEVRETTAAAFKAVVCWLYTESLSLEGTDATDVLLLARRYLLPVLEALCKQRLLQSLNNVSTALHLLVWAHQSHVDDLRARAKNALVRSRRQIRSLSCEDVGLLKRHPDLMFELLSSE